MPINGKHLNENTTTSLKNHRFSAENCQELLQLVLDEEATPEQRQIFAEHIQNCINCLKNYEIDRELKRMLQTKIEQLHAPDLLIASIRSEINQAVNDPSW